MRNLLVVLVVFIQAVLPVWAQGIPASSSGAGGQAVVAVVQGISASQVSSMISQESTDKAGTQCGASRTDTHSVSFRCQGHDPRYSCPSGYFQSSYGWRAGGTYVCVKS